MGQVLKAGNPGSAHEIACNAAEAVRQAAVAAAAQSPAGQAAVDAAEIVWPVHVSHHVGPTTVGKASSATSACSKITEPGVRNMADPCVVLVKDRAHRQNALEVRGRGMNSKARASKDGDAMLRFNDLRVRLPSLIRAYRNLRIEGSNG
jgi:hypothetical protein